MAQNFTGVEGSFGNFTVTPSVVGAQTVQGQTGSVVRFTVTDSANVIKLFKQLRMIVLDAVEQWMNNATIRARLVTNGVSLGNDSGNVLGQVPRMWHSGDGYKGWLFSMNGKYAQTPVITVTSISGSPYTDAITVAIPYADCV